jgi:hypothetical protein
MGVVGQLRALTSLDLVGSRVVNAHGTRSLVGLQECKLSFACKEFQHNDFHHVAALPRLRRLSCEGMANEDLEVLAASSSLQELEIVSFQYLLKDDGLRHLPKLRSLVRLNANDMYWSDAIFKAAYRMPNLRQLELFENNSTMRGRGLKRLLNKPCSVTLRRCLGVEFDPGAFSSNLPLCVDHCTNCADRAGVISKTTLS